MNFNKTVSILQEIDMTDDDMNVDTKTSTRKKLSFPSEILFKCKYDNNEDENYQQMDGSSSVVLWANQFKAKTAKSMIGGPYKKTISFENKVDDSHQRVRLKLNMYWLIYLYTEKYISLHLFRHMVMYLIVKIYVFIYVLS